MGIKILTPGALGIFGILFAIGTGGFSVFICCCVLFTIGAIGTEFCLGTFGMFLFSIFGFVSVWFVLDISIGVIYSN